MANLRTGMIWITLDIFLVLILIYYELICFIQMKSNYWNLANMLDWSNFILTIITLLAISSEK